MERETARDLLKGQLKPYVESITKKSKGANMYVCPLCHSGEGAHGTGAFSIKDETSWKCFSCNRGGDIFDLIGEYEGIPDFPAQLKRAGELFGIDVGGEYQNQPRSEQYTHSDIHTYTYTQPDTAKKEDYTDFYLQANKDIEKTSYHRGLTLETLNRFKVGYVEKWKHPKAPERAPATPRLIIPTSEESYLARDTRDKDKILEGQKPYQKMKVGSIHIFNAVTLRTATRPIYIVEGEIDALSIIDVGGEAVGLGSINYTRQFIDLCKAEKPTQPFIIALDNEQEEDKKEKVERACQEIERGLEQLNIPFYRYNPTGDYKDANEALLADRDAFRQAVEYGEKLKEEAEIQEKEAYLNTSTANYIQSFIDGIADSVNTPYISTGFNKLDEVLDGGLYEGLYIIGAISSLGKTTLLSQIGDQIAQTGKDVLIFSLEMARTELMAKSISRHTLQEVLASGGDVRNAKTTRGITTGKRYEHYNSTELSLISKAVNTYSEYANHIFISEGVGDIGVEQIRETVKKHIRYTGNVPVILLDYLQILSPYSERATDKQNTDKAVLELKRISRDYKTPVLGISSLNRANYKTKISMEAFKESGAIEYSSDVLIGLQLKGVGETSFNENEAKSKDPREIELVVLKNRNGRTGTTLSYKYYPLFNYFTEEKEG